MSEISLPTLYKTSKTVLLLLKESLLPPLESKIINNSLIWSMKKCSLPNFHQRTTQEVHQLIWEVKSEILLKEAVFTLLLLSKEPVIKTPFHCLSLKKFWETTEDLEESKETFFQRMLSLMELMLSMPVMKTLDFSD